MTTQQHIRNEMAIAQSRILAALAWDNANPMREVVLNAERTALMHLQNDLKRAECLAECARIARERAALPWYKKLFA